MPAVSCTRPRRCCPRPSPSGEETGHDGAAVLRAAIAGYEAVCRIAAAVPHGFHTRGVHATHACGVFSAALIATLLTGEPPAVMVNALGIAGSAAGGLLEFLNTGSSTKQLHPGTAALNGILAARLATAGASGPASVLEGDKGLYAALSARPADPERIVAGLGTSWETAAIGIKPYPACQLLHAALDAVGEVLDRVPGPEQVARVVVGVHPDSAMLVCEPLAVKLRPRTPYDAKFSLPWSVAALLTDRAVDLTTYAPESVARPEVADLAAKVECRLMDETGPAADAAGQVTIYLADGREVSGWVPASRGTARMPLTDRDVMAKFVANCGGAAAAAELADLVLDLASAPSLARLLKLSQQIADETEEGG